MYNSEFDHLDTTLNLHNESYRLHHKENDNRTYINFASSHSRLIKSELIYNKVSNLSSDKSMFDRYSHYHNSALDIAGYKDKVRYSQGPGIKLEKEPAVKRIKIDISMKIIIK